jgi:hypothetical protein
VVTNLVTVDLDLTEQRWEEFNLDFKKSEEYYRMW